MRIITKIIVFMVNIPFFLLGKFIDIVTRNQVRYEIYIHERMMMKDKKSHSKSNKNERR